MMNKQAIKQLCVQALIRTGTAKWLKFKQSGYTLRLGPETAHRWLRPDGARPVESFFRRYIKPGDVVIDAGANVGVFTLVSALMSGPTGRVYAIEAHPRTFNTLRRHIADNRATNVVAFNVALGRETGSVRFTDADVDSDLNHVVAGCETGITVEARRLDSLIREPRVALLKIDVEGYEQFVLEGAAGILPGVECILIEVEEPKCLSFGYTPQELLKLIQDQEFIFLRSIDDTVSFVPAGFVPKQPEDLIAVRDVRAFLARTRYQLADLPLTVPSLRAHKAH